jgi:CBS domain-containing protein
LVYSQPIHQIMKQIAIREVKETDSVSTAIQRLDQCNISALPVRSEAGIYSGVISKSDIASLRLLKLIQAKRNPDHILVREIMNRTPPIYVMEHETLQTALHQMHQRHIHRLFVADAEYQLIGVISTSDIIRLLVVGR